jgi:magnesium-transporting ATPase (P-type)
MATISDPSRIAPKGLSEGDAQARLRQEGANELPRSRRRRIPGMLLDVLKEPMILLLVATGTVYLILGDREEALLLLGSIGLMIGLEFYQERKTERALEALRDLSSPRARVVDGQARAGLDGRSRERTSCSSRIKSAPATCRFRRPHGRRARPDGQSPRS